MFFEKLKLVVFFGRYIRIKVCFLSSLIPIFYNLLSILILLIQQKQAEERYGAFFSSLPFYGFSLLAVSFLPMLPSCLLLHASIMQYDSFLVASGHLDLMSILETSKLKECISFAQQAYYKGNSSFFNHSYLFHVQLVLLFGRFLCPSTLSQIFSWNY